MRCGRRGAGGAGGAARRGAGGAVRAARRGRRERRAGLRGAGNAGGARQGSLLIAPQPGGGLTSAATSYETRFGRAVSDWSISAGALTLWATVPTGTSATVKVPAGPGTYYVPAGSYTFTAAAPSCGTAVLRARPDPGCLIIGNIWLSRQPEVSLDLPTVTAPPSQAQPPHP
ncbi:hypothetical protein Dfulv_44745 [Dactylosporangium fulvum]|uniref:Alpha-L-rhamnosidase C-terminal domain-containing protein n=1 Tax=Dactylosporangium fulvum TaxID=53359 RepID=A0ABY5VWC0_9ACTN|nr:alpha-L-rhamnosidase C-terminal domain-containing protein [Dactylosporangium fulvum]UWP82103.1 hypothetical protein Dfulv_44745 [Dactylosporangium fulvum]